MNKLTISTAIATYNGAEFLPRQLDSILAQDRPVDEIVVCDDNSKDNTWEVLQEYQAKYPEIFRIFRNEKNLGVSGNFEKALSLCSGDIIFIADQDDFWQKDKTEKMAQPFEKRQILGVYSDSLITDNELNSQNCTHLQLRGFAPEQLPNLPQLPQFARRVPPAAHDMAIRRSALKFLIPFPKLKNVHDSFIGLSIAALNGWAVIPETLTMFCQHGKNLSNSGQISSLAGQFRAAKKSAADDTFNWNAKLYAFVLRRLDNKLDDDAEAILKERLHHSHIRSQMGKVNYLYRVLLIAGEIFSGRYFRFARGIKSIIQDLFLR